jgi:hypothetical protein
METQNAQQQPEGLVERAASLLRDRNRSSTQDEIPLRGSEEVSGRLPHNIEQDSGLIEAFAERIRDTVRFSPPAVEYSLATALRDATYRRLRSQDIASAHVISLTLAIAIELILVCFIVVNASQGIQTMRIVENLFIGVVYAQSAASAPATLPQSTVVGFVWLAALVLAIVILGLFWSAYLAKSKNEKAQTILQHLVNTVSSVAIGAVVSKGIPTS